MSPKNFSIAWRIFSRQKPFKPYTIEFSSGGFIEIDHPEAILLHKSLLIFRDPEGVYHLFDAAEVTRFISGKKGTGTEKPT